MHTAAISRHRVRHSRYHVFSQHRVLACHSHFPSVLHITGRTISTTASTLSKLPIFTPSSSHSGLDLLAAAASAANPPMPKFTTPHSSHALLTSGPYNPAASLPPKVVKKILDLEFVEISEISIIDDVLAQTPGRPPAPARPPITDISQWVERFSLMAAVLCTRFPDKAPELWAYQATIVRAERNYDGKRWVTYDRQFRREALARKDLNWSVTDPRLYNEAFTGRARSISRCTFCLQDNHTAAYCPHNPNRPVFG